MSEYLLVILGKDFVEHACGEGDIVVSALVRCMCVLALCIHASILICPGHDLYICAWISK